MIETRSVTIQMPDSVSPHELMSDALRQTDPVTRDVLQQVAEALRSGRLVFAQPFPGIWDVGRLTASVRIRRRMAGLELIAQALGNPHTAIDVGDPSMSPRQRVKSAGKALSRAWAALRSCPEIHKLRDALVLSERDGKAILRYMPPPGTPAVIT